MQSSREGGVDGEIEGTFKPIAKTPQMDTFLETKKLTPMFISRPAS